MVVAKPSRHRVNQHRRSRSLVPRACSTKTNGRVVADEPWGLGFGGHAMIPGTRARPPGDTGTLGVAAAHAIQRDFNLELHGLIVRSATR